MLDADTGELKSFSMKGDTLAAAGFCAGLPRPVRVAYEAGPTRYAVYLAAQDRADAAQDELAHYTRRVTA